MLPATRHLPAPLPQNLYPTGDLCAAYERCLWLQESLPVGRDLSVDDSEKAGSLETTLELSPVVAARVLGYGLLYSFTDAGRNTLSHDILSCGEDKELLVGLAHLYVYGLLRVCEW